MSILNHIPMTVEIKVKDPHGKLKAALRVARLRQKLAAVTEERDSLRACPLPLPPAAKAPPMVVEIPYCLTDEEGQAMVDKFKANGHENVIILSDGARVANGVAAEPEKDVLIEKLRGMLAEQNTLITKHASTIAEQGVVLKRKPNDPHLAARHLALLVMRGKVDKDTDLDEMVELPIRLAESMPAEPRRTHAAPAKDGKGGWILPWGDLPLLPGHTADAKPIAHVTSMTEHRDTGGFLVGIDIEMKPARVEPAPLPSDDTPGGYMYRPCDFPGVDMQGILKRAAVKTAAIMSSRSHHDSCICEPCVEAKARALKEINKLRERGEYGLIKRVNLAEYPFCTTCGLTLHAGATCSDDEDDDGMEPWRYFADIPTDAAKGADQA